MYFSHSARFSEYSSRPRSSFPFSKSLHLLGSLLPHPDQWVLECPHARGFRNLGFGACLLGLGFQLHYLLAFALDKLLICFLRIRIFSLLCRLLWRLNELKQNQMQSKMHNRWQGGWYAKFEWKAPSKSRILWFLIHCDLSSTSVTLFVLPSCF